MKRLLLTPSRGTPGEGWGEGSASLPNACSISKQNPHPTLSPRTGRGTIPRILAIGAFAFLIGCGSEPFTRPPLPKLDKPNARDVQADFKHSLADQFSSEDSVIIDAPFHDKLAFLGVLKVNRPAGTYEVVGLNQLGVELFHLTGDHTGPTVRSAIPQLAEQKDVLLNIGQDVYHMFFDLVPPMDASYEISDTTIRYTDKHIIYDFGGKPIVLLEKCETGTFGDKWRVQYFDYAPAGERLYPRGIVMDNGHYHYQVTVKNRDWQSDAKP